MSLKVIKPKHREIARRMITNQPIKEIALELRVSEGYLVALQRDPLFIKTYEEMEAEVHQLWLEKRGKAMDILEANAPVAAQLCVNAVVGQIDGVEVPLGKRLESAWDVLNRTGVRAPEKRIVANVTLQDIIIQAYKQRNNGDQNASQVPSNASFDASSRDLLPEVLEKNEGEIEVKR